MSNNRNAHKFKKGYSAFENIQAKALVRNNIVCIAIKVLKEEGLKAFFKKTQAYLARKAGVFAFPYLLIKIKRLNYDLTLDELVNFAFDNCAGLIRPLQVRSEITELLKIVERMKPKIILEIGTAKGGTLFLFSRISSEDATIISVDLPKGRFGGGYSKWRKPLYKSFAFPNQKIHLLRMDSHKRATLEQVKAILEGEKCDLLFIDGDHTYEGIKRDFEMYSPLIRKGGIVAFHDIVPHLIEDVGVPQFWSEIKEFYKGEEIVEDWEQRWAGIGLNEFK